MLRRLALALSLSTAIVAAGAGTATAGPAIAGIMAFAATPLGGVVVNAAIGLAFSGGAALIDHLTKPPEERPGARPVAGYSGSVPNDPTAPIGFTMGTRAVAGTIGYRGVWGQAGKVPNAFYVEERILSDMPLGDDPGPAGIVIGKKLRTIDWNAAPATLGYPIPAYNRDGKDHAWARWHNGEQVAADSYMRAKFGDHPDQPYTAGMVGRGQAKLIVTFRANPKLFKKGFPEWKVLTAGIAMYNIAKDTTAGGDGAHRINDPATWEPSDLLPVHIFNGLLGVRYGSEWVWGGQSTAPSQLPAANWIAAIAEANTLVGKKGGGTERQYVGGLEIAGDMEPAAVFEHQLRACSGRFAEIGGTFKMLCGLPASPVMSFTDSSLVISRPQQHEPFPRPEATFNALLSKYYEPSSGWQLKELPERRNDDWIAEDGGYRPANNTYEAVTSATQGQRLDDEAMRDSRRWRRHTHVLPPAASELEPLDLVAWSSAFWGYESKTFLLDEIDDEETFEQLVTIREVEPTDHGSYDPETDQKDMVFPTLDLSGPTPTVMAGYQAFADVITGDNGARRPKVRLRVPGGLDDVASITATVLRTSDVSHVWTGTQEYRQGLADGSTYDVILGAEVLQLTAYQIYVSEIPMPGSKRDVVTAGPLDVTTGNVPIGPEDVYGLTLETLAAEVRGIVADTAAQTRAILEQAQELATLGAGETLANYSEHAQMRRELQIVREDVTARYTEAITVALTSGGALVSRIELLEATVNTTQAEAIDLLESRVDTVDGDLVAMATAITKVSAGTTPGDIGSATLSMVSSTGVGGVRQVAFQVENAGAHPASLILRASNVPGAPTEILMDAQRFVLGDFSSGAEVNPLVYSGGVWRLNVVSVGTVSAGLLQSLSGASFWNLSTGAFRISTS
jgi:hypothetical protein